MPVQLKRNENKILQLEFSNSVKSIEKDISEFAKKHTYLVAVMSPASFYELLTLRVIGMK